MVLKSKSNLLLSASRINLSKPVWHQFGHNPRVVLRRLLLVITPPVLLVWTRVEALAAGRRIPGHVGVRYGEEAGGVEDAFCKGGLGRGGTGGELPVAEQSLHRFEVRTEVGSSGVLMLMLVVMMGRWG